MSQGNFHFQLFNPDGSLVEEWDAPNGKTIPGVNNVIDCYFGASTKPSSWAIGLIEYAADNLLSQDDTMASHDGWDELTAYTQTPRPPWAAAAAVAGLTFNSVTCDFTINASKTVWGAFMVTGTGIPGSTTGLLFSTAEFTAPKPMTNGQVLKVTYTTDCSLY